MLTLVNRNPNLRLAVMKCHHADRVFEYQVHNEDDALNPIQARFPTKKEADAYIKHTPVAPEIETRSAKSYPKPVHVRTGTGSK